MNRKIVRMPIARPPVGQSHWVVTNGYRCEGIFRFKADAEQRLANIKAGTWEVYLGLPQPGRPSPEWFIMKGCR